MPTLLIRFTTSSADSRFSAMHSDITPFGLSAEYRFALVSKYATLYSAVGACFGWERFDNMLI